MLHSIFDFIRCLIIRHIHMHLCALCCLLSDCSRCLLRDQPVGATVCSVGGRQLWLCCFPGKQLVQWPRGDVHWQSSVGTKDISTSVGYEGSGWTKWPAAFFDGNAPGWQRVPWKLPPFRCDFVGIIEGCFRWICSWLILIGCCCTVVGC